MNSIQCIEYNKLNAMHIIYYIEIAMAARRNLWIANAHQSSLLDHSSESCLFLLGLPSAYSTPAQHYVYLYKRLQAHLGALNQPRFGSVSLTQILVAAPLV